VTGARRSPNSELERVRKLPLATQRRMTVLTVWCESGRCSIARVWRLSEGRLLERRRSTLLGSDDQGGLRVGAQAEWLEELADDERELTFAFSCDCNTGERHWAIGYEDVLQALADRQRNLGVAAPR
jgi:hypothetical protein